MLFKCSRIITQAAERESVINVELLLRRSFQIALGAMLTFVGTSCYNTDTENITWANEQKILLIANGDEPQSLDPQIAVGSNDFNIINALFEGLVDFHPKTLEIIPAAAESWSKSEDGRTYTFVLRENLRWSNGEPLTSEDFRFAWIRALEPALASPNVSQMFIISGAEAYYRGQISDRSNIAITAEGRQLRVHLTAPAPYFLQLLTHPVFYPLHRATLEKSGELTEATGRWTRPGHIVSNGPFTLAGWRLNQRLDVIRNSHYWDAAEVGLNGIRFLPIDDQLAEERAFRTGRIHLTYTAQMAIEKIGHYARESPELLQQSPTYATYYYVINTARAPFDNAKVRRALALAIDRAALVRSVTRAGEQPAVSLVPADPLFFRPPATPLFDPVQARHLLSSAGYPEGTDFPDFDLLYNAGELHRKVAIAVQQMWKDNLGIQAHPVSQEWKTFIATQNAKNYTISRAGWIADFLHPVNFFETLTTSSPNNDTNWGDTTFDALIKNELTSPNSAFSAANLNQANTILLEEMPVIPLFHPADNNLVRPEVAGWYPNILHRHPYKGVKLRPNFAQDQRN